MEVQHAGVIIAIVLSIIKIWTGFCCCETNKKYHLFLMSLLTVSSIVAMLLFTHSQIPDYITPTTLWIFICGWLASSSYIIGLLFSFGIHEKDLLARQMPGM